MKEIFKYCLVLGLGGFLFASCSLDELDCIEDAIEMEDDTRSFKALEFEEYGNDDFIFDLITDDEDEDEDEDATRMIN